MSKRKELAKAQGVLSRACDELQRRAKAIETEGEEARKKLASEVDKLTTRVKVLECAQVGHEYELVRQKPKRYAYYSFGYGEWKDAVLLYQCRKCGHKEERPITEADVKALAKLGVDAEPTEETCDE